MADLRRRAGLAVALGVAFLLFNVWDLTLYPLVADDEVLLNEPARVLAVDGTLESPLLSPDHVPRHVLVQPPMQALAVGAIYAGAGFGGYGRRGSRAFSGGRSPSAWWPSRRPRSAPRHSPACSLPCCSG